MATSQDDQETQDISRLPALTFEDVVKYSKDRSGCSNTAKACKFMAEPGYLHDIKVIYNGDTSIIGCKCYRSMRKSEPPHKLEVTIKLTGDNSLAGRRSCVAGIGGFCHHVVGLLYYLALLKQLGHKSIPDELTCTMMKQRWSVPRGKKIEPTQIQDVLVKKPQMGAVYSKYIKSTIYSPATMYGTLTKETFDGLEPQPLFANIVPSVNELSSVSFVPCKFGDVPKGCVLSYQQKLSTEYIINDFTCTGFPVIPLDSAELGFQNNFSGFPLNAKQQAAIQSLAVTPEACLKVQEQTVT